MRNLAGAVAKLAGWLSRRLGRGGGTTLPGVVLLKLRPQAIAEFANELNHGTVVVSATNGKTTTARLLSAGCEASDFHLVTNSEGSNLERGVATALLKGHKEADLGLFEVDEAALPAVVAASQPAVIVLMNLFRDQLDRYGELETLVDKWRDMIDLVARSASPPTLVLNADDPNIAALGRGRDDVVWFGLDDLSFALSGREHAADATTCRVCDSPLRHDAAFVGHLGHWRCTNCDNQRPTPTVTAAQVSLSPRGHEVVVRHPSAVTGDDRAGDVTISSSLPGLHNAYNTTAAFAASWALAKRQGRALKPAAVADAIGNTEAAFGRGEVIEVDQRWVQLLLAKNPTGVNQNVRTLLADDGQLHVLALLNDRTADGQDVSWVWDVDWEPLMPRLASLTLGGERAWDLALRFRYAGMDMADVRVSPDIEKSFDLALDAVAPGKTLHVLPTYTAMLDLRYVLTHRGHTSAYWADEASV